MCLGSVQIDSVACPSDPAVLLAAGDGRVAALAPPGVEPAGAWAVGVVAVAAVEMVVEPVLERVSCSLEQDEVGAEVGDLAVQSANKGSCCGSSWVMHSGPLLGT